MKPSLPKIISLVLLGISSAMPMLLTPSAIAQVTVERANYFLNRGLCQVHSDRVGADLQIGAALQSSRQALDLYEQLDDLLGVAQALGNIGVCHLALGNREQAIEAFQQSLALARQLQNLQTEGNALGNLGSLYILQGKFDTAIEYLQSALEIAERLNNTSMVAQTQELLEYARTQKEYYSIVNALGNLGYLYMQRGEFDTAIAYLEKTVEIAEALDDDLLVEQGQQLLVQAQEARTLSTIVVSGTIGELLGEDISDEEILGYFIALLESFAQSIQEDPASALLMRSFELRAEGNYEQAIVILQEYLIANQGDLVLRMVGLQNLAITYWQKGDLASAETTLKEMMSLLESWGRWNDSDMPSDSDNISGLNIVRQTGVYENLQNILVLQEKYEEALEIAERGRARAIANLLAQRTASEIPFDATPPSVSDIQAIARAQAATLVQYSIIHDELLFIYVIQPEGDIHFVEVDLSEVSISLDEMITRSRYALGAYGRGGTGTVEVEIDPEVQAHHLKQLHTLLIEPIASLLPDKPEEQVIFVPQGDLFLVPFPALQNADSQYLIERHTVSTAPSLQLLELTRQRHQYLITSTSGTIREANLTDEEVLIVGNPVMPTEELSRLPGAQAEAEDIAELWGSQPVIGQAATERFIKQNISTPRILHLATHGLLDFTVPENEAPDSLPVGIDILAPTSPGSFERILPGALAFTPGNGEDGFLTAAEIFAMNLSAELVVLSACDTGRGEITGEGIIGLSRSFIAAGTPSLVVSLWTVPDAPTADLMVEFHRQIQQGQDKAQALRQAMLITLEKHPNPLNWAGFTLIGATE